MPREAPPTWTLLSTPVKLDEGWLVLVNDSANLADLSRFEVTSEDVPTGLVNATGGRDAFRSWWTGRLETVLQLPERLLSDSGTSWFVFHTEDTGAKEHFAIVIDNDVVIHASSTEFFERLNRVVCDPSLFQSGENGFVRKQPLRRHAAHPFRPSLRDVATGLTKVIADELEDNDFNEAKHSMMTATVASMMSDVGITIRFGGHERPEHLPVVDELRDALVPFLDASGLLLPSSWSSDITVVVEGRTWSVPHDAFRSVLDVWLDANMPEVFSATGRDSRQLASSLVGFGDYAHAARSLFPHVSRVPPTHTLDGIWRSDRHCLCFWTPSAGEGVGFDFPEEYFLTDVFVGLEDGVLTDEETDALFNPVVYSLDEIESGCTWEGLIRDVTPIHPDVFLSAFARLRDHVAASDESYRMERSVYVKAFDDAMAYLEQHRGTPTYWFVSGNDHL